MIIILMITLVFKIQFATSIGKTLSAFSDKIFKINDKLRIKMYRVKNKRLFEILYPPLMLLFSNIDPFGE